jgi:osmotically-inducible protein OsmY
MVVVLCVFPNLLCAPVLMAAPRLDDKSITLAVETELVVDPQVSAHLIDVQTVDGVVVLSGFVDNLLAKKRAQQQAERIKGVRSVVNNLTVKPVTRADEAIMGDVKQALRRDPATEAYEVAVQVNDGVVTLTGIVDSWQERHVSAQVATSVQGVKEVHNDITINFPAQRRDSEIKADIERRLATDAWVDAGLITVHVNEGKVTLRGTVGSAAEQSRAAQDTWGVYGVRTVDASPLDVQWWRRVEMRRTTPYTPQTDAEIAQALTTAFQYDPRLAKPHPDVTVDDGVVTLTGVVKNLAAKHAAGDDAVNTRGVWHVRNDVRVRPETLSNDAELVKDVRAALTRDPYVERHGVQVTALNGQVYLAGTVNSLLEKTRAERVAASVPGVISVVNTIQVLSPESQKSDWEMQYDIRQELLHDALLDSDTIRVSVQDKIATLTGTVATPLERRAAVNHAQEGGALIVRDHLQMKPSTSGS